MSTMQKLMLIGYLGRDPETRYTPSGTAVTTFSIATTEKWKDRNTQAQQERTTWHYCECWGRTAEVAAEYLHKGAQVYIEGKIRNEEWDDKDNPGQKKRMTKVRVDSMQFLQTNRSQGGGAQGGGGGYHDNSGPPAGGQQQQPAAATAPVGGPPDDLDDDIPF